MLIRLLVGLSGSEYSLGPGDERDFPNAEAIRLIEAGYAVPALGAETEKAIKSPAPERRTKVKRNVVSRGGDSGSDQ